MNVQNIPRSDKVIKRCFVPKLDAFLFADYSQIELRLLAYYLAEVNFPEMAEVIKAGKDLHTESTRLALQLTREPTEEERQIGKTLNFSIVYGGGMPTVTKQIERLAVEGKIPHMLSKSEIREILDNYHAAWPGIGRIPWQGAAPPGTLNWFLAQRIIERGHIKTLYGRHLHMGDGEGEHKLLNKLVQGSAADLMRASLVRTHKWLMDRAFESHLVNTVHDEMILDCCTSEIDRVAKAIPGLMDHPVISKVVPVHVDLEISSQSWADKEAYVSGTS